MYTKVNFITIFRSIGLKHYVILTQTANYCDITSAAGQMCVQMAYENVIQTVKKSVPGDSLKNPYTFTCVHFIHVSPKGQIQA